MSVARSAGATDTGRKRRGNEDAYVVLPPLFAVADGMGGPQAGEVASRLAAAALEESHVDGTGSDKVIGLIQEANRRVHAAATEDRAGMGTTITVALVEEDAVVIGHVGDSRSYRLRDGMLEQLTEDHSLVGELVRSGKLSPEEARVHPQRSVITRALGTDPDVDVDVYTIETAPGDIFLVCSDGLSSMIADDEIRETLEQNRSDLDQAVKELIKHALDGGGEDNITVIAFEIGEPGAAPEVEELERTREHAVPEPETDEDTLDELDGVGTVGDTMVLSAADIQAAAVREDRRVQREAPDRRRSILAPALLVLLVALIVGLVVWGLTR